MAIRFREVVWDGFGPLSVEAPGGAIVGVIGGDSPALEGVLRLACGLEHPVSGGAEADAPRRLLRWDDPLDLSPAGTLALAHTLAPHDAVVRARTKAALERLRRAGTSILLLSHEHDLLREICDEVWWIEGGRLAFRGTPSETLAMYDRACAKRLAEWAAEASQQLLPSMRRGDGRAELVSVQTLDASGAPSVVLRNGETASVRVSVRFAHAVADPVLGIMIRTRIGSEVFGTNTELEGLKLGPVEAGTTRTVLFSFTCNLCPQEYTLTAASHDPDGVWHDWMEDAILFTVAASRYTAGVADLKAKVRMAP
ncbi:MAG: Wzt carbohydrate-binding domain-containing protein [Bryobacteraceae bacterium]